MKKLIVALILTLSYGYPEGLKAQTAVNDHSTTITFNTLDGVTENAFYIPSDSTTGNVLIIFHERWGLTTDVKKEAERWKAELGNVDVYAIDMYGGKVTTDPEVALKYSKELSLKRGDNIIRGLLSKIGADKRIITLGWGDGAAWAFRAAVIAGDEATGCVLFYGTPEKEEKNVRGLHADVLYNWASNDKMVQKFFVDDFGRKVEKQGRKFELHTFNAAPSFADPTSPMYNAVLTAEADKYALVFIKLKFQIE